MSEITARKLRFEFDEPIELDGPDEDFAIVVTTLGVSLTLPYLEPYLIRTMKAAIPEIRRPGLVEDARAFSQQEGHHFRNHSEFNKLIHSSFSDEVAAELGAIEAELEADYQRFTREESLSFNLGYAEGFEAMTCALALAAAEFPEQIRAPGGDLFIWHLAEEIEHRSVAFDVFDDVVGSLWTRMRVGAWAQWHYLGYIARFAKCMAAAVGRPIPRQFRPIERAFIRNYLRTWSPRYDPARLVIPPSVPMLLADYDARVAMTR